uniref:Uncharacterized protein n=1 Tax=Cucumis sativus TaxID=3659 RepID=A0A0A0K673_CUCSA
MAAFFKKEEYHYFSFERTRAITSRSPQPPPPLHKKSPYEGEIQHLRRSKNNCDHTLIFECSVNSAAAPNVREAKTTINSKQAAQMYGGINIVDFWTKKPATTTGEFRRLY